MGTLENQRVRRCGYTTKKVPAGFNNIHYPALDGLAHTYIRMLADFDPDYEESYGKLYAHLTV
jgi:hypothetical protein